MVDGLNLRSGEATKGKWRILDMKVESDLISDSKLQGDSPRPCQLRIDRLVPVSKFDYVLAHARFMRSRKPSSFYNCLVKP
jgi:hypothetical protein